MKTKTATAALVSISLVTGCASYSEDIATTYVSPLQYKDYDCDQIGMEMESVSRRVGTLTTQIDDKAEGDAWQMGVGAVLFFPTLFFLEGGDGPEAAEYARLKGEFEALEKVSIRKKCDIQIAQVEPQKDDIEESKEEEPKEGEPPQE